MEQRLTQFSGQEKFKALLSFSNPTAVLQMARKHGYDPNTIFVSPLKTKKYMIITPEAKRVHFGAMFYEDFTKHGDKERRNRFRARNNRWAQSDKYSPAKLSYVLLW